MTEKEKMLKGILYDSNYDEELKIDRLRAKDLYFKFTYNLPLDEKTFNFI